MWRFFPNKNQKALFMKEGKPTLGEITGVETKASGKILVTIHTQTGETTTFDMITKLAANGFKLLPEEVYEDLMKKRLARIRRHSIVETSILSGRHKGTWIKAEVFHVDENTMNMTVLFPSKWNVAATALGVPNQYIRAVSGSEAENYSIPIEFTIDDSVICVSCNKQMKVRDLKKAVHKARGFPLNQIYFLHEGEWLSSSDAVPNNRLFCIINRGGRLTNNLVDLTSSLKKRKRSANLSVSRSMSSSVSRSANSSVSRSSNSSVSRSSKLSDKLSSGSMASTEPSSVMGRSELSFSNSLISKRV